MPHVLPAPEPESGASYGCHAPRSRPPAETSAAFRYLTGPVGLVSLLVLASNDHLLKGSGWLPGPVTGKLSDFAGLMIAPALLCLVPGVKARRWWLCMHLVVGAAFAVLKLSPSVAQFACDTVFFIGLNWTIIADPSDLVALAVLPLAYHRLCRSQAPARDSTALQWRRICIAAHLLFCTASSNSATPEDNARLEGTLFIHNDTRLPVELRIATLTDGMQLDCNRVAADPGRLVTDGAFTNFRVIELAPEETTPVELILSQRRFACSAALVEGPSIEASVLFWFDHDHPNLSFVAEDIESIRRHTQVILVQNQQGGTQFLQDTVFNTVHPVLDLDASGLPTSCELTGESGRLAWSEGFPEGPFKIARLHGSLDDCVGIEFDSSEIDGLDLSGQRWHICLPIEFPFDIEDSVDVRLVNETTVPGAGQTRGLSIRGRSASDDSDTEPQLELILSKGSGIVHIGDLDLAYTPVELARCRYEVEETCGTTQRRAALTVTQTTGNSSARLEPGPSTHTLFGAGGQEIEMTLISASQRPVLDSLCSEGSDDAGFDFELLIVRRAGGVR